MDKVDIEVLEKLNQLKEKNILTEEEFNAEKNKILNKSNSEESREKSDLTTTTETENLNTSFRHREDNTNREKAQTTSVGKALEYMIYIISAIFAICMVISIILSLTYNHAFFDSTKTEIANEVSVLYEIAGFTWVSWFICSTIYIITMLKNGLTPKIVVSLLIWIMGILEIAGNHKAENAYSVIIIVASGALIILDLATVLSNSKANKIYKCPECGSKLQKNQSKCTICKKKINWD